MARLSRQAAASVLRRARGAVVLALCAGLGLAALAVPLGAGGGSFVFGAPRPTRRGAPLRAGRPHRTPRRAVTAASLQPLSSYVLVKPKEAVTATKGGILLPSAKKDRPNEGEVLSVGPGSINQDTGARMPIWAEVGKKVMYSKYGAEKVTLGDEEYALVRDGDMLLSYDGDEPTLENVKMPYGKVLVRLPGEVGESDGGLLLSKGAAKPDTTVGSVVAVSEGVLDNDGKLVPLDIQVGDMVRFSYGSEVELEVGKSDYQAIDAEDCLAKWKE